MTKRRKREHLISVHTPVKVGDLVRLSNSGGRWLHDRRSNYWGEWDEYGIHKLEPDKAYLVLDVSVKRKKYGGRYSWRPFNTLEITLLDEETEIVIGGHKKKLTTSNFPTFFEVNK